MWLLEGSWLDAGSWPWCRRFLAATRTPCPGWVYLKGQSHEISTPFFVLSNTYTRSGPLITVMQRFFFIFANVKYECQLSQRNFLCHKDFSLSSMNFLCHQRIFFVIKEFSLSSKNFLYHKEFSLYSKFVKKLKTEVNWSSYLILFLLWIQWTHQVDKMS